MPFRNLISSSRYYLLYQRIFSNCDDTTVDNIIVNYKDACMASGTVNSRSGTDTDIESEVKPVTRESVGVDN